MTSTEDLVSAKVEQWRNKLLDIGNRNPLIRYRQLRSSTLKVDSPVALDLFRELDYGHPFTIVAKDDERAMAALSESGSAKERSLIVSALNGNADRAAYNMRNKARAFQMDHGVNVLFAAIGLLRWEESGNGGSVNESPLFLVPVGIEKKNVWTPFVLNRADDDIVFNESLKKRLKVDFGFDMPTFEFDENFDIRRAFTIIKEAIPKGSGWTVLEDAFISPFHFTKYLMYLDLEDGLEAYLGSPVIRALAGDPTSLQKIPEDLPKPEEFDRRLDPSVVFQVLDADSSQQEAVLAALSGTSFVLEGPPGTGKSQTITNMIAELMAVGRTVLFVSEKMAALDVVKGNLDQVGLGSFCLELHSQKKKKSEILLEIGEAMTSRFDIQRFDGDFEALISSRRKLDDYALSMNAPIGRLKGATPHRMIGEFIRLSEYPDIRFELRGIMELDDRQMQDIERSLDDYISMIDMVKTDSHPWMGSISVQWSDRLQDELEGDIDRCIASLRILRSLAEKAFAQFDLGRPMTIDGIDRVHGMLAELSAADDIPARWIENGYAEYVLELATRARDIAKRWTESKTSLMKIADESILTIDAGSMRDRFVKDYSSSFRALNGSFRRDLAALNAQTTRRLGYVEAMGLLTTLYDLQAAQKEWSSLSTDLTSSFIGVHPDMDADWDDVVARSAWTRDFLLKFGSLVNDRVKTAMTDRTARSTGNELTALKTALDAFRRDLNDLRGHFLPDHLIQGRPVEDLDLVPLATWMGSLWDARYEFREWQHMISLLAYMNSIGLDDFLMAIRKDHLEPQDIKPAFYRRFHRLWIEEAIQSTSALKDFRGDRHGALITRFNELDRQYIECSRDRLKSRVLENRIRKTAELDPSLVGKQSADIARLVRQKRPKKAIRSLLADNWEMISLWKPVLLMSPLSVSQFLKKDNTMFDVVIFDEASQICPEDAIGSIARGRQVIVVGDSKQMPPTSFFLASQEDEENDMPDLESILDECQVCGLPTKMLMWHYRSKDEALIAFSNHHFYNDLLNTFPGAAFRRSGFGVRSIFVPEGRFDRGGSRVNIVEAMKVARMVKDHFSTDDGRSLGVIAFSEAQMEAIDNELISLSKEDPVLNMALNEEEGEHFLLYNLENVQGHERDRIILSVGYGKDGNDHFTHNFGPLNRDGGERRLNVAITRARQQLDIVTSIRSDDIDLDRSRSRGVRLLKDYLRYAESSGDRNMLACDRPSDLGTGSSFEEEVGVALKRMGYEIHRQIGCSNYRIDLAVVDPEDPGRYLLGIECDGASYHSGRTARDRDRLRRKALEKLGWEMHHVWGPDWFRNPSGEAEKIRHRLEEIIEQRRTT